MGVCGCLLLDCLLVFSVPQQSLTPTMRPKLSVIEAAMSVEILTYCSQVTPPNKGEKPKEAVLFKSLMGGVNRDAGLIFLLDYRNTPSEMCSESLM